MAVEKGTGHNQLFKGNKACLASQGSTLQHLL
jgi:hypothetical protein